MAVHRTPLGRARGAGSSKTGVGHFIVQRVTGGALVLLLLWGVWSAMGLAAGDYGTAVAWLHSPVNTVAAALLGFIACWHMQIGMRTVIEDYFHTPVVKAGLLVANIFVSWAAGALILVCLLKVAFGGGTV